MRTIASDEWDELVERSKVPVLVEFRTSSCPVCATMQPAFERIAEELGDRARVYRVNVELDQGLAMRYGVQGVPTYALFCSGNLVQTMVGEVYPKLLERMVDEGTRFGGDCASKATKVVFEISGYM